ncbi:MAG: hypothetical protein IT198_00885 [Acidimicrobiia bacterium]|nr:hypothetical protein [Acidimicrobiia bacterium]
MTRLRRLLLVVTVSVLVVTVAGCNSSQKAGDGDTRDLSGGNYETGQQAPSDTKVPDYGKDLAAPLTIGLVISSAGDGKDFQNLANGTHVVPALVEGDTGGDDAGADSQEPTTTTRPAEVENGDDTASLGSSGDGESAAESDASTTTTTTGPDGAAEDETGSDGSTSSSSTTTTTKAPSVESSSGDGMVEVVSEDDLGTPEGAVVAVNTLIAEGADVIVYGSVGPQVEAGIAAAEARGVAVLLPYDSTQRLVDEHDNAFMTALPDPAIAKKMVEHATQDRGYTKIAVIWDKTSPYAVSLQAYAREALAAQGLTPVANLDYDPATDVTIALREKLTAVGDAAPEAVIFYANSSNTFKLITEWHVTGQAAQMYVAPRAATPNLGAEDINALTPPVRIGTLSTGIAGGPWNPTAAVVNFYDSRDRAKKAAAANLDVADIVSADAGLLAVAAAERGGSTPDGVLEGLDGLAFDGIGATYDFATAYGVTQDAYAITSYNREQSASQTYVGSQFPDVRSAGGFWVAVPGTAPSLENINVFEE